jgi:manganese/zinc/iron transport system permease protein
LLIVCAVVIGLQTVGVVLMAAMLITPAISARYWTDKLSKMIILSGIIGGISGGAGTLLSTITEGMATGPLIIVSATCIFILSLVFAPKRGLFAKAIKQLSLRKKTAIEQVMLSYYDSAEAGNLNGVTEEELQKMRKVSSTLLHYANELLQKKAWIRKTADEKWLLTDKGIQEGFNLVLQQRLYEMYLMHEMEFSHLELKSRDDLNLDTVSSETKDQLFELLKIHDRAPQLIPESSNFGSRRRIVNDL